MCNRQSEKRYLSLIQNLIQLNDLREMYYQEMIISHASDMSWNFFHPGNPQN
jgi:hypothetical protein